MTNEQSYRHSHRDPSKGVDYDQYYRTQPWQKFLWSREQEILTEITRKYFKGRDIHLLDFACGTGRIASFLENQVKTSTGVDVSSSMLEIAKKKLKRTEIIRADITTQDVLPGRKFNLITAFRFFLNAEPGLRTAAIRTLAGLLTEDGYLVFNNHHNFGSPWIKYSYMRHRQKRLQSVYNVMTIKEMKELVQRVGLEIIEVYAVGFFHPPRIPVSYRLNHALDSLAGRFRCLIRFSEDPVAVCTWHKRPKRDIPVQTSH